MYFYGGQHYCRNMPKNVIGDVVFHSCGYGKNWIAPDVLKFFGLAAVKFGVIKSD